MSTENRNRVDVQDIVGSARFGPFHWTLLFWCTLLMIFDGYDVVIYGVVLPVLMKDWGLSPTVAGFLGSCALFGMMFGALFFGSLSDKVGRRGVILTCVVLFSGFTVLNGFARNPVEFGICRFLAGLGIGGVMPNLVTLINEYSPRSKRGLLVAVMFSGYAVGGMLSAGLGIWLIPQFGWQAVFFVAGIPLVLLPLIVRKLPESIPFLLLKGRAAQARSILERIDPRYTSSPDDVLNVPPAKVEGATLPELFRMGRWISTLALWLVFFCCLLMVYALINWLPSLMLSAGYGLGSSLAFLLVLNLGAIVGAVCGGWLGDRFRIDRVLLAFFVIASTSVALLGFKSPMPVLYLLVGIAGAAVLGGQILANACVVQFYPAQVRSTGLGWALSVGRTGAIAGPILGGTLVAMQLPLQVNFLVFAAFGLIGALAMLVVVHRWNAASVSIESDRTPLSPVLQTASQEIRQA